MRTCGEAVALFAEKEEAEPWGECPHGASGGAFEFLMHGLRPTEPCPECGEIPTFGNTMMSLGFHADGPVEGVDGREHPTCPECGDDALELEGGSIVEWGWKIACLNCGWEMKQAETLDIAQYCDLMPLANSGWMSRLRTVSRRGIRHVDGSSRLCAGFDGNDTASHQQPLDVNPIH